MPLADSGAAPSSHTRKPKHTGFPALDSVSSGSKPPAVGPTRGAYSYHVPAPQPVLHVTSALRRKPGPYNVNETAWGASAFASTKRLQSILPKLRSKLGDEQSFNSLLSRLMQKRYDTFEDRLDRQFDHDRAVYQRQLSEALDAQREGLPYQMPEMPEVPHIKRGQGVVNLMATLKNSIKPGMSEEEVDAYTKFYTYELDRLIGYSGDIRNQRNSLLNYKDQYLNESQLVETRDENDQSTDSPYSPNSQPVQSPFGGSSAGPSSSPVTPSAPKPPQHDWQFLSPRVGEVDTSGNELTGLLSHAPKGKHQTEIKDTQYPEKRGTLGQILGISPVSGAIYDETKHIAPGLTHVLDESVGDPLMWTLDKLSRPLYGVNNAMEAYYKADNENGKSNVLDGAFLAGKNPLDSLDDMSWGNIKNIVSEFGQGLSGKDKTTFGHVIAENAANDGRKDYRDNQVFQTLAGLTGDLLVDPLNFVGVGLVTKPVTATRESITVANDLRKISQETVDLLDKARPVYGPAEKPLSAKDIYGLLSGHGRKPLSASAKTRSVAEANARVQRIVRRLKDAQYDPNMAELDSMESVGKALQEQRAALLKDFEGQTVVDSLRRDLEIKVQRGFEPQSALDEFDDVLRTSYLAPKIAEARYYGQYLEKAAREQFNVEPSYAMREVPIKGSKTVATPTNLMGRKENISVPKGGTKKVKSHMTSTAWENVGKRYENLKSLAESGQIDRSEVEAFRKRIDEVLENAPAKSLDQILPELARDYRFTPEQINGLYKESEKLAWDDPRFKRLSEDSRAIYTQEIRGRSPESGSVKAAQTRKDFVDRQKDRIQASIMIKMLKQYAGKEPIYKDADRVRAIRAEIRNIERNKDLSGSTADSVADTQRLSELKDELKSLKGIDANPTKKDISNIPVGIAHVDPTTGELVFSESKLRSLISVNKKRGEVTFNTFRIGHTKDLSPEDTAWLREVRDILQERYNPVYDRLYQPVKRMLNEIRSANGGALNQKDWAKYNKASLDAATQAEDAAFKSVIDDIQNGRLATSDYSDEITLRRPLTAMSSEQELMDALKFKYNEKEAQLRLEKYTAQRTKNDEELARIDQQLAGLREKYAQESVRQKEILKEAQQAKHIMAKRLREEALLYAARMQVPASMRQISLKVLGNDLVIPHTQMLFDAVESFSGLPLIKQTRQAFANAFQSPASQLAPDIRLARDRAIGRTPNIIEWHINDLKRTLGQIPEHERVREFDSVLKGQGLLLGESHTQDLINASFEQLLPYFNRKVVVGDKPLTVAQINRYLPDDYKISEAHVNRAPIETMQDLMNAIRQNKATVNKADRNMLKDPYRVSWNLRLGIEQASARQALEHTINSTFGVKDVRKVASKDEDLRHIVGEFHDLGWRTVPQMGNTHLFPPEILPDIHKLLDMMEPRNLSQIGHLIDRGTGYWKTITTIYNPGYWTRNGVGEIMASWFDGVTNPRWYKSSADTIKYARGDGKELDALKSQFAMLDFVPSESVSGNRVALRLKDGTPVTHEQVWVAYNDQGLKTGFFNTEFDQNYSKLGNVLRQAPGTQSLANAHTTMRSAGEWYEDYLRMAHFQHALQNSGAKTLEAAAQYAANKVRKYHFDYTDFTNFEKTVMLRAFPFYKWTRKALPLMTTMLFTKPGKVMAYPKVMNAAQNTLTTHDIQEDNNGFAPNYSGIVPGWIQDLWAYQIAGDPEEGNQTYGSVAVPHFASYMTAENLGTTGYGLLNPLIKAPIETGQVVTGNGDEESILKQLFEHADIPDNHTDMNVPMQMDGDTKTDSVLSNLLRMTPQGAFSQKQGTTQDLFGFLTGLGTYRNDDNRRMGELMNRNGQ